MSWSASFPMPVRKEKAVEALDRLLIVHETTSSMIDQCELAKQAVKAILPGIPGPYVMVSISGHANGVGWQKQQGMANDCIYISVSQICEEDLDNYGASDASLQQGSVK